MERIQLTFLMTDLVGSTAHWERRTGGEVTREAARAVPQHLETWARAVSEHNGETLKKLGDGILAAFPLATDAVRCAQAGLSQTALDCWPDGQPFEVKVALLTDVVYRTEDDHYGPGLNRLSRLLATARPGEVLLDASTFHLAQAEVTGRASFLGPVALRDVSVPIDVYAIGSDRPTRHLADGESVREVGALPPFSEIVGRAEEIDRVIGLIQSEPVLVTLTGPGGIGKTSLAREVARRIADEFADGAVVVDCGAFSSEGEVAAALLEGFHCLAPGDAAESVKTALRSRHALVVLDCYEGLLPTARWVGEVMAAAPRCRFLVTSRSRLRLSSEREIRVSPLPTSSRGWGDRERLFWDVALRSADGLADDRATRLAVGEVCELLEGVPLLLQLAAARLRYVSLSELIEQLRVSRSDLRSDALDTPERHAGIARIVADSLALLPEPARLLLFDLSVFVGGFTRADAEAVSGAKGVMEAIESLTDHSLLMVDRSGGASVYRMLDSVREAVASVAPPSDALRTRHSRHFASRAASLAAQRAAGDHASANRMLLRDVGNARAALHRAQEAGDRETVAALCRSLGRTYAELGLWDDLARLGEAARWTEDPELLVQALGHEGAAAAMRGQREVGRQTWIRRLETCREIGHRRGEVDSLLDLADMLVTDGDHARAEALALEALGLAREAGEADLVSCALATLAQSAAARGDAEAASSRLAEAEATLGSIRHAGLRYAIGMRLARSRAGLGDAEGSLRDAADALQVAFEGALYYGVCTGLLEVARHPLAPLTPAQGVRALAAAVALGEQIGAADLPEAKKALAALRATGDREVAEAERKARGHNWAALTEETLATLGLTKP